MRLRQPPVELRFPFLKPRLRLPRRSRLSEELRPAGGATRWWE
jgi:hypothetical protein